MTKKIFETKISELLEEIQLNIEHVELDENYPKENFRYKSVRFFYSGNFPFINSYTVDGTKISRKYNWKIIKIIKCAYEFKKTKKESGHFEEIIKRIDKKLNNKQEDTMSKIVTISNKGLSFTGSIDDAKELAVELRTMADTTGTDLSKTLGDFIFSIETNYQQYHNFHPDYWGTVDDYNPDNWKNK